MNQRKSRPWPTILLGAATVIFTLALVVYPEQGFKAGMAGLKVFWDIVFPSLLPFFILSELMLGLGLVRGLGVLLEPLMRPVFGVPGIGAFALSMGLAAGYPMDAVITARFRETNMCSRIEGERLLAFTNTADPLFMFGAVAVGMFKSPRLGVLLAIAHYVSSFLVGVLFKFWGRREEHTQVQTQPDPRRQGFILKRAYLAMLSAREEDGRPFGKLLGKAVTDSIQTILMICGFIVFFAVLIEILNLSGLIRVLGWPVGLVYGLFGIHQGLVGPTLAGALEIDIGSAQTAAVVAAPMLQKAALVSGIIAWSGLSVHAQVASVLTETDIRMTPYFLARFLHAIIAAVVTVILWLLGVGVPASKALATPSPALATLQTSVHAGLWWHVGYRGLLTWGGLMAILLLASFALYLARGVRWMAWYSKAE